jgi:hypothetical protein
MLGAPNMKHDLSPAWRTMLMTLALSAVSSLALAQSRETLTARLSPVPLTVTQQSTIAGLGSANAVIAGTHLQVSGAFDGLRSPATTAQIHRAPKGLRGPVILELPVIRSGDGTHGTLKGGFDLTPTQRDDLRAGRWYVQLNSEKAADGNLWGWLLPKETRR